MMGAGAKIGGQVVSKGLEALDLARTVLPGKSKGTEKSSTLDRGGFGDLSSAPKPGGEGSRASSSRRASLPGQGVADAVASAGLGVASHISNATSTGTATGQALQAVSNHMKTSSLENSMSLQGDDNASLVEGSQDANRKTQIASMFATIMNKGLEAAVKAAGGQ